MTPDEIRKLQTSNTAKGVLGGRVDAGGGSNLAHAVDPHAGRDLVFAFDGGQGNAAANTERDIVVRQTSAGRPARGRKIDFQATGGTFPNGTMVDAVTVDHTGTATIRWNPGAAANRTITATYTNPKTGARVAIQLNVVVA